MHAGCLAVSAARRDLLRRIVEAGIGRGDARGWDCDEVHVAGRGLARSLATVSHS